MSSQSILGRAETQPGQNPHDAENLSNPKLLLPNPRALNSRRDCDAVGTDDKGDSALLRIGMEKSAKEAVFQRIKAGDPMATSRVTVRRKGMCSTMEILDV
jgi:hypothetical protein